MRQTEVAAGVFQSLDHHQRSGRSTDAHHGTNPAEGVDNGENPNAFTVKQLVMSFSGEDSPRRGLADEEITVHRSADRICTSASGNGNGPVEEVCRKLGIWQATFFRRKKVYGGLMPSEVGKLKQLEEENERLCKLRLESDASA